MLTQIKSQNQQREHSSKVGWAVNEWCRDTSLGRTLTYELLKNNKINFVKVGNRTIIVTSPSEFLAKFTKGEG